MHVCCCSPVVRTRVLAVYSGRSAGGRETVRDGRQPLGLDRQSRRLAVDRPASLSHALMVVLITSAAGLIAALDLRADGELILD